jgi:hypothetical protein
MGSNVRVFYHESVTAKAVWVDAIGPLDDGTMRHRESS